MSEVAPEEHIYDHAEHFVQAQEWLDEARKAWKYKARPLGDVQAMLKFAEVNAHLAQVAATHMFNAFDDVVEQRDQARDIAAALEAELALLKVTP